MKLTVEEKPSDRWSMPVFIATRWQKNRELEADREVCEQETIGGAFGVMIDWLKAEIEFAPQVELTPMHHEIVGGKHGGKQGTLIAKGWHDNYSTFKAEVEGKELEGCVTYVGDKAVVEVGKDHRWQVNLKPMISHCLNVAVADV